MKLRTAEAEAGALEPYRRLIELQKQIIELVEQNAETKRQCIMLREQLAREADALLWSRRAACFRLRAVAVSVLQRLFGRAGTDSRTERPAMVCAMKLSSTDWACALASLRQQTTKTDACSQEPS